MKKIVFKLILAVISTISLYFYIIESSDYCDNQTEFNEMNCRGKIIAKFINYKQHSEPTIILRNESTYDAYDTLYLLGDISKTYEKLKVSDLLFKRKNSDSVFTIEKNKVHFIDQVNFGCE